MAKHAASFMAQAPEPTCSRCKDKMVVSVGQYSGSGLDRLVCCPVCVEAKRTIGLAR